MALNDLLRNTSSGMRCFFKGCYKLLYMKPVIAYKTLGCPAINEFRIHPDFKYSTKSYYPALLMQDEKKAQKIYSRMVDFDSNGIPMYRGFEQRYWPVTITQCALLNYNLYLSHDCDDKYKKRVISICDWLVDNIDEKTGAWLCNIHYHCTVANEDMNPPFCSAMVQGQAISSLVRGFYLTNNEKYLECAGHALKPLFTPVKEGGAYREFAGLPFYEEYPTKKPSMVLNGFIYTLFGLYDLGSCSCKDSVVASKMFEAGYNTLVKLLPLYDGGFCSRYSLSHITVFPNYNSNPLYHPIHVNQLIAINSIRRSPVLEYYIKEWK